MAAGDDAVVAPSSGAGDDVVDAARVAGPNSVGRVVESSLTFEPADEASGR